jgi:predicted nucleotidyltransferase
MEVIIKQIQKIAQKINIDKVILFGSRARLDNNTRSDIDLAIYTDDIQAYNNFLYELESIETLLKFDVTLIADDMNEEFLDSIAKEGKIIYEKL